MLRTISGFCIGIVITFIVFASFNGDVLKPSPAYAQTAAPTPGNCASAAAPQVISQIGGILTGTMWGFFVCIADLDGNGKNQVIVGQHLMNTGASGPQVPNGSGFMNIVNNNGTLRKKICWGSEDCPAVTITP